MSFVSRTFAVTAGVLALAAASPAMALSIVGAERIRVTSAAADYLQVAELAAIELGSLTNVAAAANGASASASSALGSLVGPSKAIDGSTAGSYNDFDLFHSAYGAGQYLDVFLSHAATLGSLTIWGRADCCGDRDLYDVEIFGAGGASLYAVQLDARQTRSVTLTFDAPPGAGAGPIPEPDVWALLILGFGAAGSVIRRRRAIVA